MKRLLNYHFGSFTIIGRIKGWGRFFIYIVLNKNLIIWINLISFFKILEINFDTANASVFLERI